MSLNVLMPHRDVYILTSNELAKQTIVLALPEKCEKVNKGKPKFQTSAIWTILARPATKGG